MQCFATNVNAAKKEQNKQHFFTLPPSDFQKNKHFYLSLALSMRHICLSLFAPPWPDLFWSFIISPLLLFFSHTLIYFFAHACMEGLWRDLTDNKSQFSFKKVLSCVLFCVHDCECLFLSRVTQREREKILIYVPSCVVQLRVVQQSLKHRMTGRMSGDKARTVSGESDYSFWFWCWGQVYLQGNQWR